MAAPILKLEDINLHYGAAPILDGMTLMIHEGDRLALLGRNGSGKSTALKIIAGNIEADGGSRWVQPGTTIAYLEQEPDASEYVSLKDYILSGLGDDTVGEEYRADVLAMDLNIDGATATKTASGGELRRAALARALIGEPDLLLLDEPTNHLDISIIKWLEQYLAAWRGAFVVISHDRAFLKALTSGCLWLDRGIVRRLDKGFAHFRQWQEDLLENERLERHKLDRLIKEEARWSVEGISARRKRNMGRMRRLQDLRQERRNMIAATGKVVMDISAGKSSGTRVIDAKDICKSYDAKALFTDFSIRINRGDKVGIIGPNGVGKTTLIRVLLGEEEADCGTIKRGTNLETVWIDQKRQLLDETTTLKDTLTGGRGDYVGEGDKKQHFASYMKDFLFDPNQANQPVEALSGGERNRLLLAKYFANPSNFIVLDEPTNDLDMETLDLLQELLSDFEGTVLLVSHDRDFLDRIVTSSIVMEGDGSATEYAGGYSDYLAQRSDVREAISEQKMATKVANVKSKVPKKLSYKDQRELDNLPAEVEALATKIQQLQAEISDPDFYSRDPEGFTKTNQQLADAEAALEAKEYRWLELEELKDSLR